MRRKDREITDRVAIDAILAEATVCRIGLADGDEPYVVPVTFGYEGGVVYLHSAPEGKKIDLLRKNPRCCIEADICDGLVTGDRACSWGVRYRSIVGYGRAEILSDPEKKQYGLNCIMQHYGGGMYRFSEKDLESVTVIRIPLESVTGKKQS